MSKLGRKNKRLVLGTRNKGKLREIRGLLRGAGIAVSSAGDFPGCPKVTENGKTFESNACKKARIYSRHTGLPTLADDSGLVVPYLKGRPGVSSARFAGRRCSYQDNNRKLLRLMIRARGSQRRARFVCAMALYEGRKRIRIVRGECRGRIAFSEKGNHGFGYDPVFIPRGFQRTFAQLPVQLKNRISHRGKALRAARKTIVRHFKKG